MKLDCDRCGHQFETRKVSAECPQCGEMMRVRNPGAKDPVKVDQSLTTWIASGITVAIVLLVALVCSGTFNSEPVVNENQLAANQDYVDAATKVDPRIVAGKATDSSVILVVAQSWHLAANQFRLQNAQDIVSRARGATSDDTSVILVDVNGNEVGGTGFSGVWVQD